MIDRLIGQGSTVDQLKSGLSDSTRRVRGIAHRVASATAAEGGFAQALNEAQAGAEAAEAVDLEKEMTLLAEESIRFEAATSLLSKVYEQVRMGIRER